MTTQNQIPAVLAPSALPDDTLIMLQVVGVDSALNGARAALNEREAT